MKAIILLAGNSTRTYPLTVNRSKYALKVLGKSILERNLEQLYPLVDEFVFVVNSKDKKPFGSKYKNKKITYCVQKKISGTGLAILAAQSKIKDNFLLIMGDDLYSRNDIKNLIKHDSAILVQRVSNPENFGVFSTKGKYITSLVEKPKKPKSKLANTGCYYLSKEIFQFASQLKKSKRGEYEITDAINGYIKKIKTVAIQVKEYWLPISYPWSLLDANNYFLDRIPNVRLGKIEKNVTIKGKVIIEKGAEIKSGTYIEGPVFIGKNSKIGPNTYLRAYSVIEENCKLGNFVEIKNTIVMKNTTAAHLIYLGDSIVGENCNIAAGTITANLRHDGTNIKSMIGKELKDSGRRKLGAIIGDNVKTGINTTVYEGRKIWPEKMTKPGEIVKKDIT